MSTPMKIPMKPYQSELTNADDPSYNLVDLMGIVENQYRTICFVRRMTAPEAGTTVIFTAPYDLVIVDVITITPGNVTAAGIKLTKSSGATVLTNVLAIENEGEILRPTFLDKQHRFLAKNAQLEMTVDSGSPVVDWFIKMIPGSYGS